MDNLSCIKMDDDDSSFYAKNMLHQNRYILKYNRVKLGEDAVFFDFIDLKIAFCFYMLFTDLLLKLALLCMT